MFRFLLRDPLVWVTAILVAGYGLVTAVPEWHAFVWARLLLTYGELPLLGLTLLALSFPRPAREKTGERLFWTIILSGVLVWLLAACLRHLLISFWPRGPVAIVLDSLGLFVLLSLAYAGEIDPLTSPRRTGSPFSLRLEILGATVFGLGLFGYFVLIPSFFGTEPRSVGRLPYTLFACLNLYLLARFTFLAWLSPTRRWRLFYGLIGGAVSLGTFGTLVRASGLLPPPSAQFDFTDPLIYLSLVFLIVAGRLRHFSATDEDMARVADLSRDGMGRRTSRLTLYALLLPVIHFGFQGFRPDQFEPLAARDLFLLIYLGVLGGLALVQYNVLQSRSLTLEKERAETEQRLRLLTKGFETMRLGVTVKDLSGTIIYANPAEARMHGFTVEELIGKSASMLGAASLRRPMRAEEVKIMNCWRRDSLNLRRDGTTFPVHLISDLVRASDGEPIALVTTCEDITERKRIESALRQSESDYRGLFENAHDAILIFRPEDEYILDANPSACQLYGYQREELIGMSLERLAVDPLAGKEHVQEALWKGDFYEFETRQYRRDRSVMYLEVRAAIIKYRDQLAIFSINRDITDRKRSEDALKAANEDLKTFLSLVSHDLRAPLVNLKGFAVELRQAIALLSPALQKTSPQMEEDQRQQLNQALGEDIPEALEFIESSVSRMDYLIEELLKLSRAGRRELTVEPLDMEALARGVLNSISYQINRCNVKVHLASLPRVAADRVSMTEILSNLLSNAVAYREPSRPCEIEIGGRLEEQETTFWVKDNSRGIAAEDLIKVFHPFRRCGRQDVPGEGMGLAYVQVLVRRQGGRLWVDSTLGKGSTFHFTISNRLGQNDPQGLLHESA